VNTTARSVLSPLLNFRRQ